MSIWFKKPDLEEVNSWSEGTLLEHIGIEISVKLKILSDLSFETIF